MAITAEKAIGTLEYMVQRNPYNKDQEQAIRLGIEALKNLERARVRTIK